jgi:hypothetical protein
MQWVNDLRTLSKSAKWCITPRCLCPNFLSAGIEVSFSKKKRKEYFKVCIWTLMKIEEHNINWCYWAFFLEKMWSLLSHDYQWQGAYFSDENFVHFCRIWPVGVDMDVSLTVEAQLLEHQYLITRTILTIVRGVSPIICCLWNKCRTCLGSFNPWLVHSNMHAISQKLSYWWENI